MEKTLVGELSEREALALFKGWFNNKMMLILIMSQYPRLKPKSLNVANQIFFLHDLEHHFLRHGTRKEVGYNAIRWLKAFFRVYPDGISPKRSRMALKTAKLVYDAFGFPLYWDIRPPVNLMVRGKNAVLSQKQTGGTQHESEDSSEGK